MHVILLFNEKLKDLMEKKTQVYCKTLKSSVDPYSKDKDSDNELYYGQVSFQLFLPNHTSKINDLSSRFNSKETLQKSKSAIF